ncbi:SDR family NAD(P)-dependent oxidoreductase [Aeromicrobium panaciterrae]|uniref:SDR family NAD(P)-dependent oxidoreductase n=1 Tax=Aeromicrobium panaciterrae TaxID=363861 RepID=UPI0031DD8076
MSTSTDRVVVVTGASRGAGKGIALALAPGSTVYVTGRTATEGSSEDGMPGTVTATADEITERGGKGIAVVCDHRDDEQVRELFERVRRDHGHVDILVNNAFALRDQKPDVEGFWNQDLNQVDVLDVGLRSHYVTAYHAVPLMLPQRSGLIVTTSAPGGRMYMIGPAYGAAHAGGDKMAHDFSVELRPHNIASVVIWMGLLRTERALRELEENPETMGPMYENSESPEYTGRVIDALARDPHLMERSGLAFWGAELGAEFGLVDIDGSTPLSNREWLGAPTEYGAPVVL